MDTGHRGDAGPCGCHVCSAASPHRVRGKGTRRTEASISSAFSDPRSECVWPSHAFDKWLGVGLEARASGIPFPSLSYAFLHRCGELRSLLPFLPLQNRDCGHVRLEAGERQAAAPCGAASVTSSLILSRCVWLHLLPCTDLGGFLVALYTWVCVCFFELGF